MIDHRGRTLDLLRQYTDAQGELTRHLARRLGVNATDALAVAEILWAEGDPLTPARLAERVGLTSGATTSLLNRLEEAGLIVRSREDADRRIVRLRLPAEVRAQVETFFAPQGRRVARVLDGYGDETLTHLEHLLTDIVAATTAHNDRLRESAAR